MVKKSPSILLSELQLKKIKNLRASGPERVRSPTVIVIDNHRHRDRLRHRHRQRDRYYLTSIFDVGLMILRPHLCDLLSWV